MNGQWEQGFAAVPLPAVLSDAPQEFAVRGALDLAFAANPTASRTTARFALRTAAPVTPTLYDVAGRRVATVLTTSSRAAGAHEVGLEMAGLSAEIYFAGLEAGAESAVRRSWS